MGWQGAPGWPGMPGQYGQKGAPGSIGAPGQPVMKNTSGQVITVHNNKIVHKI